MSTPSPFDVCDRCGFRTYRGRCGRDRCEHNSGRWLRRHGRRIKVNLAACRGDLLMFTITGPGGLHSDFDKWAWNVSCWERFRRLRDLAGKQARREVPDVSSRLVAWVPELQERGLLHFHLVFDASTVLERRWAERYCRYLRRHVEEHGFGPQTAKGKWGREGVGRYVGKLASYLTKGSELAALWESGDMPGRAFYVSRRLTEQSGCTMRRLRVSGRFWASERVSLPVTVMPEWAAFEEALGRQLTSWELRSLGDRAPPPSLPPS